MTADLTKTKPTDLVAQEPIDDLVQHAGRGTEQIGSEDVRPPRLLICQSGSPQRKPDDPKQIPGLNELDLFNDLSGDIYGRGPLPFVVISSLGHRHIQFRPMEEGGGVIDFNVPDGDERTLFHTDEETGERLKPVATKFYDYLVWLPQSQEMVVLSMKSTQLKTAVKLNGLLKLPLRVGDKIVPEPPAWARTYSIETRMEKDGSYSWGGFNLRTMGTTPVDLRHLCAGLADTYGQKRIIIETDENDQPVAGEPIANGDVPF